MIITKNDIKKIIKEAAGLQKTKIEGVKRTPEGSSLLGLCVIHIIGGNANETAKLPDYTEDQKPIFYSTPTSFTVILKNVSYHVIEETHQETRHEMIMNRILSFCEASRSKREIADFLEVKDLRNLTVRYINPLIRNGRLKMTIPEHPKHRNQIYVSQSRSNGNQNESDTHDR